MAKQESKNSWKGYVDVVTDIKNDRASRIYLICGEEKYLVDKTINEMKKLWIAPGAESLDFYLKDQTTSEMPLDEFQSLVGSPPFLSKYRLTVIRNSGLWATRAPSVPTDLEKWKAAIAAIPEFACVVFVGDSAVVLPHCETGAGRFRRARTGWRGSGCHLRGRERPVSICRVAHGGGV